MSEAARIKKSDIVNAIIRAYGFTTYLEYNKYDGGNYFDEVECAHKEIAFIPEYSYVDSNMTRHLLKMLDQFSTSKIATVEELISLYAGRKFDVIFFDPLHVRPAVDQALQLLPLLLNEGGFLIVHDCSPEDENITARVRTKGEWVGETYKAFALFHKNNPTRSFTVREDYGVGVIMNADLNLSYDPNFNIDYGTIAADRRGYLGLCTYDDFQSKLQSGKPLALFADLPTAGDLTFIPEMIAAAEDAEVGPPGGAQIAHSQLFWHIDGIGYSEQHSQQRLIQLNGKKQNIRFVFPELSGVLSKLRLDFTDKPASAELNSLRLLDPNSAVVWEWRGDSQEFIKQSKVIFQRTGDDARKVMLVADGLDPHFEIDIPESCLARIRADWRLDAVLVPQDPTMHAALNRMAIAELKCRTLETALQKAVPEPRQDARPGRPGVPQLQTLEGELLASVRSIMELRGAINEVAEKNARLMTTVAQHDQTLTRLSSSRLGRWLLRKR